MRKDKYSRVRRRRRWRRRIKCRQKQEDVKRECWNEKEEMLEGGREDTVGVREEIGGGEGGEERGIKIEVEVRKEGVRRGRSSNSYGASSSIQEVMSLATTCDWTVCPAVTHEATSFPSDPAPCTIEATN